MNEFETAALDYSKRGFSVIPVGYDKRPLLKWEAYQREKATPEHIKQWSIRFKAANIGIVTGAISNLVVVDVDKEDAHEALSSYIPDSIVCPTVKTPRGGRHLYFRHPGFTISNNTGLIPGSDFRGDGGYVVAPPSSDALGKHYEWIVPLEESLPDLPAPYISFINSFAFRMYKAPQNLSRNLSRMFEYGTRDNDLFHVANCLVKGGMPKAEITQVLESLIASWGENPDPKWIEGKIGSALKRADKREVNLSEEVARWISVTDGDFSVTDCFKTLQTVTRVTNRDNIRQILHRLKKDGVIEKVGKKDGVYRRIEHEAEDIDFINVNDEILEIKWPFGIENWVHTLPKNIVVVAGEPNAGKTAFLLNVVRMNMQVHKIFYFSSEMGALELRNRLEKFGLPLGDWSFKVKDRSSNFADVIRPDDINIVDFLELTGAEGSEFYKVGAFIKEIYDRLRRGIAVIAIQKNPTRRLKDGTLIGEVGLGGMRGMEKARIYATIGGNVLKLLKAKNWATQTNPNGLQVSFKLIQGARFQITENWKRL
jgi:hypothetical protein